MITDDTMIEASRFVHVEYELISFVREDNSASDFFDHPLKRSRAILFGTTKSGFKYPTSSFTFENIPKRRCVINKMAFAGGKTSL